ncbi:MAG: flagellar assembly protein A [Pseudomonadota bacterium]
MQVQADDNPSSGLQDTVTPKEDSALKLIISDDRMEALLIVDGPLEAPEEQIRNRINQELISRKIVSGIDTQAIGQCIAERSSEGEKKYVIVRGMPPVPGKDSEIVLKNDEHRKVPSVSEYLRMDQKARAETLQVEAGDLVAVGNPAVKGGEGRTVTGDPVAPVPVQDVPFRVGQNLRIASGKEAKAKFSGTVCINSKQEFEIVRLDILVKEDKMEAALVIGGMAEIPKQEIRAKIEGLLRSCNIVCGIDGRTIDECLAEIPSGEMKKYLVARGSPPGSGTDARIIYYLDDQEIGTFEEYAKIYSSDRNRDFHVRDGHVLAVKVSPEKGSDGFTITGESLPAPAVQDVAFRTGKNVRVSDDRIEAKVAGTVLLNEQQQIGVAPIQVFMAPDKMEAALIIGDPGEALQDELRPMVDQILARKKITSGIDESAIQESIAQAASGQPKRYIIARGVPPKPGQDAAILFKPSGDRRAGTMDQHANIDFRDRGSVVQVNAGDVLAIKTAMIKGEPGVTVTGETLPAQPVHDAVFKVGKNVGIVDGERVEAKISGAVSINSLQQIEVSPVFPVQGDVDYSVGNISFDGLVQISGCIRSGFRVRAGSLIVGFIEPNAKIEVKGDMSVKEGMLGADVKVGGFTKCGYIRRCRVSAEGDIVVDSEIVDSNLSSLGQVLVTRRGGRILNSTILAKRGVETYNLGSESSPPCDIILGVDYRSDMEIETLNEEILQCGQNLEKLEIKFREVSQVKQQIEANLESLKKALPASLDTRQKYRLHMQCKDLCLRHKEFEKNYKLLLDAMVSLRGTKRELEEKRQNLMNERKKVESDTYLTVKGIAFEQNRIRGKIALLDMPDAASSFRAHETVVTHELEDGRQEQSVEIRLTSL